MTKVSRCEGGARSQDPVDLNGFRYRGLPTDARGTYVQPPKTQGPSNPNDDWGLRAHGI
jgi:hypothetical protein